MKIVNTGRRAARVILMQSLYAANMQECTIADALEGAVNISSDKYDHTYFSKVNDLMSDQKTLEINNIIRSKLDGDFNVITKVELSVLQLALYEYFNCTDVPSKVILNEALEIAKSYGSNDGHKLVNGVLDKVFQSHER